MRLTTKGRFAVTAMIDLALRQDNGPVTLAGISQRQDISLSYLEQLFGKLRRHEIVESVRGPGGGYHFAGNPRRVTLLDVIELFEGPAPRREDSRPDESAEERALRRVLADIDDMETATLRSASITSLVRIVEAERKKSGGG